MTYLLITVSRLVLLGCLAWILLRRARRAGPMLSAIGVLAAVYSLQRVLYLYDAWLVGSINDRVLQPPILISTLIEIAALAAIQLLFWTRRI